MKRAATHGGHFIWCRERQVEYLMKHMDRKPIVVAPYVCELFGHWWFEGPDFIYYVLKKTALESPKPKDATTGKTVVKVIVVPKKLVNIVVK